MLSLILRQTEDKKQTLHLEQELITLGRAPKNVIVIENIKASREHAKIERVGATFQITDLSSGNGTRVNGLKIDFHTLAQGDEIKIGDATIEVLAIDSEADASAGTEEPKLELQNDMTPTPMPISEEPKIELLDEPVTAPVKERETEIEIRPSGPPPRRSLNKKK